MNLEPRFWAKVEKTTTCWNWTASLDKNGYGQFHVYPNGTKQAHRLSYEFHNGPIPDSMEIDHICENKRCVNPLHLKAVSHRENLLRSEKSLASINRRKRFCPKGHPLSGENLDAWFLSHGMRRCRICANMKKNPASIVHK